jgi:hypothetical protein
MSINLRSVKAGYALKGKLDPYFETGTEGVIWSVVVDGYEGYDSLLPLKDGDQLKVLGSDGQLIWSGVVNLEWKRNWRLYPMNPAYGQQAVLGLWVHGLQSDVNPEVWARWFLDTLRCEVIPTRKN